MARSHELNSPGRWDGCYPLTPSDCLQEVYTSAVLVLSERFINYRAVAPPICSMISLLPPPRVAEGPRTPSASPQLGLEHHLPCSEVELLLWGDGGSLPVEHPMAAHMLRALRRIAALNRWAVVFVPPGSPSDRCPDPSPANTVVSASHWLGRVRYAMTGPLSIHCIRFLWIHITPCDGRRTLKHNKVLWLRDTQRVTTRCFKGLGVHDFNMGGGRGSLALSFNIGLVGHKIFHREASDPPPSAHQHFHTSSVTTHM
uniref:Uncharacterized protein n=1 Tax=Timema cristinae TaxID=61476 RepID=A0A7R9H087_TIMCR|nr:unnamed protein product [Timema cristinae]